MIRSRKVRPYMAVHETSFGVELYPYEAAFAPVVKQNSPIIPEEVEIVYDGGGVAGVDGEYTIIDGNNPNSNSLFTGGSLPQPSKPKEETIIYDGGGVVIDDEYDEVIFDGSNN